MESIRNSMKDKPQTKPLQSFLYNNCQTYGEELEDAFTKSEILYLIEYIDNRSSNHDYNNNAPKNYMEILTNIKKFIDEYNSTKTMNLKYLKELCLNLWLYCMGWTKYKKGNDLLQLIDTNCNELFNFLKQKRNIQILMQFLKICLSQHKKSIEELLEESQGIIEFNDIHLASNENKNNNNENIKTETIQIFWQTFEIINICMNSILCISWSQRNRAEIKNNALFIEYFHIDQEPLFIHLFNYIAQENYCDKMPIKKFITYIKWHLCLVFIYIYSLFLSLSL